MFPFCSFFAKCFSSQAILRVLFGGGLIGRNDTRKGKKEKKNSSVEKYRYMFFEKVLYVKIY